MEFIDNELLIFEVQKFECIYDVKCEDYKNRNLKAETWMKIAKAHVGDYWEHLPSEQKTKIGKEIQNRWRSLRDAFLRSLRIEAGRSGRGIFKRKPYVYAKHLNFLLPSMRIRPTSGNTLENEEDTAMDGGMETTVDEEEKEEKPVPSTSQANDEVSSCSVLVPPRTILEVPLKRIKESEDSLEKETLKILRENKTRPVETDLVQYNEDKMFMLSLLPHLKDMTNSEKLDFKIQVMQLIKSIISIKKQST